MVRRMKHWFLLFGVVSSALSAHVVDIHVKTPSEIAEEERMEQERENEKNWEIFEDENRSDEERREALGNLVDAREVS